MKKPYILAAITVFLWSTIATVSKLMLDSVNSFQFLWISSLFAFLFLGIVNIFNKKIKMLKGYTIKDYITIILIGLPGTAFYYFFYYSGADLLPASQAFIINYMWPILSVVFACILLGEKFTVRKITALFISFIGVAIVGVSNFEKASLKGIIFCLLGAVSYGSFTALNQKYNYDKSLSMMINFLATFVLMSVFLGIRSELFVPALSDMILVIWNGVLVMAIATTLWALALESGKTAKISNLAYITPFVSLIWVRIILKEELAIQSIIGLVIIVFGIFVQLSDKRIDKQNER